MVKETPNYYSILPANVRYDKNIRDKAKLLYSEITALSNKDGSCYATNKYFAELYGVSSTTISTLIKELVDAGYIESEIIYKEGTKEILNRYLKIFKEGIKENLKDNNINNNIYNSNNNKIIETIENEFGTITPIMYEKIYSMVDEFDNDLILEAIKECSIKNIRNIKYLYGILNNWKKENINNIKDLNNKVNQKEENTEDLFSYNWLDEE